MTQTVFEHAIEAEGLVKHYGEVHALDGLDLTVEAGTVFGQKRIRRSVFIMSFADQARTRPDPDDTISRLTAACRPVLAGRPRALRHQRDLPPAIGPSLGFRQAQDVSAVEQHNGIAWWRSFFAEFSGGDARRLRTRRIVHMPFAIRFQRRVLKTSHAINSQFRNP